MPSASWEPKLGETVIVWEPGKAIIREGKITKISSDSIGSYLSVDTEGPYFSAFCWPQTTEMHNFISTINTMISNLEQTRSHLNGLVIQKRQTVRGKE